MCSELFLGSGWWETGDICEKDVDTGVERSCPILGWMDDLILACVSAPKCLPAVCDGG
jgi:hypothetical protein